MSVLDASQIDMLLSLGQAVFAEIAGVYIETTPVDLQALQAAHQGGDRVTVTKRAHALKGASANVGATRLWELCGAIESGGASDALLEEVFAEHARVVEALRARL